jgi:hypothetical protein
LPWQKVADGFRRTIQLRPILKAFLLRDFKGLPISTAGGFLDSKRLNRSAIVGEVLLSDCSGKAHP